MAGMLGVSAIHFRLLLRPPPIFTRSILLPLRPVPHHSNRLPPRTLVTAAAMAPVTNGTAVADPVKEEQAPSPLLLKVKMLSPNAVLPSRASARAAGYDLSSAVETVIPARGWALVATDLSVAVPDGTYARIEPRSGLAWKHGIDVGAGVVDADYGGPVGVLLFNHSDADFAVRPGDRVAQMVVEPVATLEVAEMDDLEDTASGQGGFGSTGA